MTVPKHIALLAAQHRERYPHRPLIVDHDIRVNDLRRLTCGDNDSRLVLIRGVHDVHVVVALVHPYTEYATSRDLVYERDGSFPVVVQDDLLSCALHEHVTVLVDRLPDNWEETAWSGPKLMGPLDARWTLKASEGDTLRSMTTQTWLDLTENL